MVKIINFKLYVYFYYKTKHVLANFLCLKQKFGSSTLAQMSSLSNCVISGGTQLDCTLSFCSLCLGKDISFLLHGCEISWNERYDSTQSEPAQKRFLPFHPVYTLSWLERPFPSGLQNPLLYCTDQEIEAQRGDMTCPKPHTFPTHNPVLSPWAGMLRTDHLGAEHYFSGRRWPMISGLWRLLSWARVGAKSLEAWMISHLGKEAATST